MTSTATAPLSPAALLDQKAGDAQRYRALLHELMDVGMELVRAVREQGTAETRNPAAAREAAVTFDLLSRAVRRTVAMARHVAEPLPQRGPARERAPARPRAVREAEDVSQWSDAELDAEIARVELRERLDRAELDDETGGRPVEDVIADICRDLGLGTMLGNHPWKRHLPADVRAPCERAAEPPGAHGSEPALPPPEMGGRFRTWSGPPAYDRKASIELVQEIMEHQLPRIPRIRGP